MKDDADLMDSLAQLDPVRGREPEPQEWIRSRARLEQIMDGRSDAGPVISSHRSRRRVLRGWPLRAGVAVAATAAAVSTVMLVLPGSQDAAYAGVYTGWTRKPATPTPEQVLQQAGDCTATWTQDVPTGGVTAADVLVADRRGPYAVTLMRKGDSVVLCEAVDPREPGTDWMEVGKKVELSQGQAQVDSLGTTGEGKYAYSSAVGQLGAGVSGVDVVTGKGTVQSTIAEGRWVAWWPGADDAVQFVVHTADGTKTYRPSQLSSGT